MSSIHEGLLSYTSMDEAVGALWKALDRVKELESAALEVCICAAIRTPDGKLWRGHRHHDCIAIARLYRDSTDEPWAAPMARDQGFITSFNRYVGREEGMRLQLAAGIKSVARNGYHSTELYSEDLY